MTEFTKDWRRWRGPRSELVRATEYAAQELREWTGIDTSVRVRIAYRSGLTDPGVGVEAINTPHERELANVDSIAVYVEPDPEQLYEARRRASRGGSEGPSDPKVSIRIASYGTNLTIEADGRTRVEGLAQRLVQILGGAATGSPGFDRMFFFVLLAPVALGWFWLGFVVARWLGLAEKNGRWDVAEVVFGIGGVGVGIAGLVGLWWLFPPIEIFDEGGAGRARRFRGWIITAVGVLLGGIAASFVYDQVG